MDDDETRHIEFCERVRGAYLEIYGSDGLETNEPFSLGTCLVLMAANHLDGGVSSMMVYDGSRLEALGLAREGLFYLLPE
jgi:hypothetical protein